MPDQEPFKMNTSEVFVDSVLLLFGYLSIPLQTKIASTLGCKRHEICGMLADFGDK